MQCPYSCIALIGRFSFAASFFIAAFVDAQTTVNLRNGLNSYTGVQDTQISAGLPTYNYGLATAINPSSSPASTPSRALLKFDVSSIPANATIGSAMLTLEENPTSLDTVSNTGFQVNLYQISSANYNWVQGPNTGAALTSGQDGATWNDKDGNPSSITPWAGSAGLSTAGTDYVVTPITTYTYNASFGAGGTDIQAVTIPIPATVVQTWVNNATSNGIWHGRRSPGVERHVYSCRIEP